MVYSLYMVSPEVRIEDNYSRSGVTLPPEYSSVSEFYAPEEQLHANTRAQSTLRSLVTLLDPHTQLPADRMHFTPEGLAIYPRTKPTNIGLGLLVVLGAEQLGILTTEEAELQLLTMLNSLGKLERHCGFFYDWYDSQTLEKLTHWPDGGHELEQFLSSVDNAWLAVSLLCTRQAKPHLANLITTEFLAPMNFEFFYDQTAQQARCGYSVSKEMFWANNYPRELLSETRIIHYAAAALAKSDDERTQILGRQLDENGTIPHTLADGALFELLLPKLFVREAYLDEVTEKIVAMHRLYGDAYLTGVVGISAADDPNDGHYKVMSLKENTNPGTVVAAHGAALMLLVNPQVGWHSLQRMELIPNFYSDAMGYQDSVDLRTGEVSNSILFLDQAMVFLSLQSYHNRYFRNLFESNF